MSLFDKILAARGLSDMATREAFLHPQYEMGHDPFLLPDMAAAVERLVQAHAVQEKITIYGDYDIDGLTATTVLLDAFESFGFTNVEAFIPNRFIEGYGMTIDAVERIAATGATLIVTVDCGSLSEREIRRAGELGVDVIVTDHHNVAPVQPPAVAVINPKRWLQEFPERYEEFVLKQSGRGLAFSGADGSGHEVPTPESLQPAELPTVKQSSAGQVSGVGTSGIAIAPSKSNPRPCALYPFLDLPGVGVAFKLVQALQTRLDGLPAGQEKWLLDLVALGTVCDVVTLRGENRLHVYWGLKVLAKTRRPGLKALMAVAGVEPSTVNARSLGFALGPRMNAAGRLETAQIALDMLRAQGGMVALEKASLLDEMNAKRRSEQDKILKEALVQAEKYADDPVLVVSSPGWNHGIIGIVAAKLLEKFGKPTFVLEELPKQHERSERALGGGGEASDSFRSEPEGLAPPDKAEMGKESKGSARSYGDFSAADAIRASDDIIIKGGGHKLAAGVTLPTANIAAFRQRVNEFYTLQGYSLQNEQQKLLPRGDVEAKLTAIDETLIEQIAQLEPFGNGNEQPIICSRNLMVENVRRMGAEGQHVKLTVASAPEGAEEEDMPREASPRQTIKGLQGCSLRQGVSLQTTMDLVAFNAPEHFFVEPGQIVDVWYQPEINEWRGVRRVEGRLLHLESVDSRQ